MLLGRLEGGDHIFNRFIFFKEVVWIRFRHLASLRLVDGFAEPLQGCSLMAPAVTPG